MKRFSVTRFGLLVFKAAPPKFVVVSNTTLPTCELYDDQLRVIPNSRSLLNGRVGERRVLSWQTRTYPRRSTPRGFWFQFWWQTCTGDAGVLSVMCPVRCVFPNYLVLLSTFWYVSVSREVHAGPVLLSFFVFFFFREPRTSIPERPRAVFRRRIREKLTACVVCFAYFFFGVLLAFSLALPLRSISVFVLGVHKAEHPSEVSGVRSGSGFRNCDSSRNRRAHIASCHPFPAQNRSQR